jgi:dsRNA-specific ribonuclease
MFRFEAHLIAQEACGHLGLKINPSLALEAVTKDSDNTDEHRGEQIQYQRGMGRNYERLEFLGDCFLKMATSIAVFARRPTLAEHWYHDYRMVLICNKNLFNTAVEHKLFRFIRSRSYERSAWYPEGLVQKSGRRTQQDDQKQRKGSKPAAKEHALGEKTIADVCEALIGAALLSSNENMYLNNSVQHQRPKDHPLPDIPDIQSQSKWSDKRTLLEEAIADGQAHSAPSRDQAHSEAATSQIPVDPSRGGGGIPLEYLQAQLSISADIERSIIPQQQAPRPPVAFRRPTVETVAAEKSKKLPTNLGRKGQALAREEHERGGKFDMAVKAVTALVNNEISRKDSDHDSILCWDDYYKFYKLPEYQVAPASHSQLNLAAQIKEKMGYHFRYPRLLRSAFIHPSYGYLSEKVPNYQRLEFLGDSLLDMACVIFLYHRYPDKDPQWLTEHKVRTFTGSIE